MKKCWWTSCTSAVSVLVSLEPSQLVDRVHLLSDANGDHYRPPSLATSLNIYGTRPVNRIRSAPARGNSYQHKSPQRLSLISVMCCTFLSSWSELTCQPVTCSASTSMGVDHGGTGDKFPPEFHSDLRPCLQVCDKTCHGVRVSCMASSLTVEQSRSHCVVSEECLEDHLQWFHFRQ